MGAEVVESLEQIDNGKGLAKELKIDESYLNRLAEEVSKDLG